MVNLIEKVVAYITKDRNLLVLQHLDFPEAGIQVPAGTVKDGETPIQATFREVFEETGLKNVEYVSYLGDEVFDASIIGKNELHHRYYFHLTCIGDNQETWIHSEDDPSNEPGKSIFFNFYWVPIDDVPILAGDLDKMLPLIRV
jgi:8-oxo-dGTP pyrophosphatase MutT (NUDIX family)